MTDLDDIWDHEDGWNLDDKEEEDLDGQKRGRAEDVKVEWAFRVTRKVDNERPRPGGQTKSPSSGQRKTESTYRSAPNESHRAYCHSDF